MYRLSSEWTDMKKSLQELLKCVCTEHLDASPVNPLVKGKIVLLNQLIKKYFSRFEITEGMHLDEVLSLSGLCMDCIVKLISSLSQHQHQLITEIVCMILDILFGLYCRCLGETELNLSIESNSLILIEGKLSASSSSTNSYLHTVYNSLKDTLEALFLIDWEPDIAINLLIHLVPMLSRVPGVVTDFKIKLNALMACLSNLPRNTVAQCCNLMQILLAERRVSVSEVYAWITHPLQLKVQGCNAASSVKDFCAHLLALLSYPCFYGLVDTLVQHIDQTLCCDDLNMGDNEMLVMLLMSTIFGTRYLPDVAANSASLSDVVENAAYHKHSLEILLRLYVLYAYDLGEREDSSCGSISGLRIEGIWTALDYAGLCFVFKYCMISCLASKLSLGTQKVTEVVEEHVDDQIAMWKLITVKANISVEDIVFMHSNVENKLEDSLETAFSLSLCSMEPDNGVNVSTLGYLCCWVKQLDSSSQMLIMRMLCNRLLSPLSTESMVASMQFILFELAHGNSTSLQLSNNETHYLLGYLSPYMTSIPPLIADASYQLQWLNEIWLKQVSSSSNLFPIIAVRHSLHPDCCGVVLGVLKALLSTYFGKNLNPNVYITSAGKRFNIAMLSTKQASRHSLSGYKEELMPSLTEHWECIIYLIGLLCTGNDVRNARSTSLYLENLLLGVARKDAWVDVDSALQDALDASWDVVAPCPFTAVDLHKMETTLHFVFIYHALSAFFKLCLHLFVVSKDHTMTDLMQAYASLLYGSFAALRYATHDEVLHLSALRLFCLDFVPHTNDKSLDLERMDNGIKLLNPGHEEASLAYEGMCILPFRHTLSQLSALTGHCLRVDKDLVNSWFEEVNENTTMPITLLDSAEVIMKHDAAVVKQSIQSSLCLLLVSVSELALAIEHIHNFLDENAKKNVAALIFTQFHGTLATHDNGITHELYCCLHGFFRIYQATASRTVTIALQEACFSKPGLFGALDQSSEIDGGIHSLSEGESVVNTHGDDDDDDDDNDSFVMSPAFSLALFSAPKAENKVEESESKIDDPIREWLAKSKMHLHSVQDIISTWRPYLSVVDLQSCHEQFNSIASLTMQLRCELFSLMVQMTNYIQRMQETENVPRSEYGVMLSNIIEYFASELLLGCEKGINLREFKEAICIIGHLSDLLQQQEVLSDTSLKSAASLLGAVQFIASDVPQHIHRVIHLALTLCPQAHFSNLCFYLIRSAELTKTQTSIELLSSDEDSVASEMSLGQDSSVVVLPDDRIVRGILQCSSLDGEVGDIVTFSNSIVGNTVIVELLKFLLKALQPLCEQQEGSEQHEKDRRDFQLMIYSALFIKVLTHLIGGFAISKRSLVSLLDQRASSVIVQALSKFITWCSEEVSAVIPSSGAVPSIVRYIIPNDQSDGFVGVPRIPCLYSFMTEAFYEVIPVYNDWIGSITKSFSKENNRRADVLDKKFGILRTKLQNLAKAIKNKKLHQVQEFSILMSCAESAVNTLSMQEKYGSPAKKNTRVSDEDEALNAPVLLDRKRKSPKKSSENKRLRSRNRVIDKWLDGDEGDDAFVDLEDFLVDEDNEEFVE